jgi:hypothetical protein
MTEREKTIAGLRAMADFYGTRPDLPLPYISGFYCWINGSDAKPIARKLKAFKKEYQGTDFHMLKEFGGDISVRYVVDREAVCKKIVVGMKEIPEMIIAANPELIVPATEEQVIPAHTEEITEWVCSEAALLEDPQEVEVE